MSLSGSANLAPLPLRLAAGAIFCFHGYEKVIAKDVQQFVEFTRSFNLPYGEILAQVAAWGEFVGGIMLILGVATRLAALVNSGTMIVALWKVHLAGTDLMAEIKDLNDYQLPLLLLVVCWSLILTGGGALSIDGFMKGRSTTPTQ